MKTRENVGLALIALVVVLSVTAIAFSARCGSETVSVWSAIASTLVLGVTAVIVVFYTAETRRMAESTEEMARATRATLEQDRALRACDLQLKQHAPTIFRLKNLGPGRAKVMSFSWSNDAGQGDHPDTPKALEPGGELYMSNIPDDATSVSFVGCDDLGRKYRDTVPISRR